ncbi:MAG: ATP-binding cassette domain-containing protein [Bacteroidetes bacterium]|nr:ATP-binding cassette domain-containing protein [Bacteroidota bacterium]
MSTAEQAYKNDNTGGIADATKPVIVVSHVNKRFGKNKVLNDFNIELNKGETLVVLGRSGAGKSVLIKLIIGLMEPDAGAINVLGYDVPALDHDGLDVLRSRVGFLFQSNALYDSMTVRENLEFPMRRHMSQLSPEEVEKTIMEVLTNVGLPHTVDMLPSELSGGMQKRIALARTLVLKPEIILYDEPTTGLDPITGKEISELIVEVQKKYNTSSIIISHDMKCVEITADRIAVLIEGRNYASGTFDELKQSNDSKVKAFFE